MSTLDGVQWLKDRNIVPDVIYIDADHHYEAAKQDIRHSLLAFPDALCVGDDYGNYEGVKNAVLECAQEFKKTVHIDQNHCWAYMRINSDTGSNVTPRPKGGFAGLLKGFKVRATEARAQSRWQRQGPSAALEQPHRAEPIITACSFAPPPQKKDKKKKKDKGADAADGGGGGGGGGGAESGAGSGGAEESRGPAHATADGGAGAGDGSSKKRGSEGMSEGGADGREEEADSSKRPRVEEAPAQP